MESIPLFAALASPVWDSMLNLLILLGVALLLGIGAERLGQSSIVGYLLAGTLLGPNVLGWITNQQEIFNIAEIGVSLLLFTIGLEFSPQRLVRLGPTTFWVGSLQVILTVFLGTLAGWLLSMNFREALIIGLMVAMSSTACVLRLLNDRAEIDSQHARFALGILLIQDMAVVPFMVLVTVMSSGGTPLGMVFSLLTAFLLGLILLGVFYLLFTQLIPRLLMLSTLRKNRDLPILLAFLMGIGSAWLAHEMNLSPALGAFAAGVLLAMSPFATQIRADVRPLGTLLITLFFAAIGMFGDPIWLMQNWIPVSMIVIVLLVGKPLVIALLLAGFGQSWRVAVATALCLGQVGEFSFVLGTIARGDGPEGPLISETTFRAMVSATIATLFLTPFMVTFGPILGIRFEHLLKKIGFSKGKQNNHSPGSQVSATEILEGEMEPETADSLILLVGFGPAGQRVAESLLEEYAGRLLVIDLNPGNVEMAQNQYGIASHLGDASQIEILEHAGIYQAGVVVLTLPDPILTRKLIFQVRDLAPQATIVARCRYHIHTWALIHAGAHYVVDEEEKVGWTIAEQVLEALRKNKNKPE